MCLVFQQPERSLWTKQNHKAVSITGTMVVKGNKKPAILLLLLFIFYNWGGRCNIVLTHTSVILRYSRLKVHNYVWVNYKNKRTLVCYLTNLLVEFKDDILTGCRLVVKGCIDACNSIFIKDFKSEGQHCIAPTLSIMDTLYNNFTAMVEYYQQCIKLLSKCPISSNLFHGTVEPHYNENLGTTTIILLYQVSCYVRVKI